MKHTIGFMIIMFFSASIVHAELLIITNKSVDEKKLSFNEIKDIFLGKKKKWSDNTKIYFVTSSDKNLHETFLKTYIHKNINQYHAYWKNMLFTGKGAPPKAFKTNKEIIDFVTDTQGAVGYIDSDSTPANVNTITVE